MFIEQYYIKKKVCDDLVSFFKKTNQKGPGCVSTLHGPKVNHKIKKSIETTFWPNSKFTALLGKVTVLEDKSKLDAKSAAATVPSFISDDSTALGPILAVVTAPPAKLSVLTSESLIAFVTSLFIAMR